MTDIDDQIEATAREREQRKREQFAEDLRLLGQLYLERPDLPLPFFTGFTHYVSQADLKDTLRALGGKREKYSRYGAIGGQRQVGSRWVRVETSQEGLCKKVKVGTKKVEKTERVGEDTRPERTVIVEEDEYEWKCPDSILEELG